MITYLKSHATILHLGNLCQQRTRTTQTAIRTSTTTTTTTTATTATTTTTTGPDAAAAYEAQLSGDNKHAVVSSELLLLNALDVDAAHGALCCRYCC